MQLKKISGLKKWTEAYEEAQSSLEDLQVLADFLKEGEAGEEEVE
ncbi:MAG TPA: peptide chain release factor 2, partial [Bacteroidetes bacterium]|nr:peptide chain release factor 2 [Bacteroidota bacterium]